MFVDGEGFRTLLSRPSVQTSLLPANVYTCKEENEIIERESRQFITLKIYMH